MNTFFEIYPSDKSQALTSAINQVKNRKWYDDIDEELIYQQIATPEFRLYEEIVLH